MLTRIIVWVVACAIVCSCHKSAFLTENPSGRFTKPETVAHCLALLNETEVMNTTPALGEQSADDYYCAPSFYQAMTRLNSAVYTWQKDLYAGVVEVPDWNTPYRQLYTLNLVLETLAGIQPDSDTARLPWQYCRGYALFMRSMVFYQLAQHFAPVYEQATAANTPGVVLLLHTTWDEHTGRATLAATYRRIIEDLQVALLLVPVPLPASYRHQPIKAAVYAALARVYLSMGDYQQAGVYADSSLQQYDALMDYNMLSYAAGARYIFPAINTETVFRSWQIESEVIRTGVLRDCIIDSGLYAMYAPNDLRRKIYFALNAQGLPYYRNGYSGNVYVFSGLATDEVWLIKAESAVMQGQIATAMSCLDTLLVNRYVTGTYIPQQAHSQAEALAMVRAERRKELVFRGLRWSDLRRYNKEGAGMALTRVVNGVRYQLLPGSKNYTLPVPANALTGTAITQTERE